MSTTNETPDNVAKLLQIQQKLMQLAKQLLNPNGDKPYVDEYIVNASSYIQNALSKVMAAEDKNAASKEVAKDLNKRLEAWIAERRAKKAEEEGKNKESEKVEPELLHEELD